MLKEAIDRYLAVRRAGGFKLEDDELYLNSFARFAGAQGDTHVVAQTAIAWAGQTRSEPQRAHRLKVIIRFAHFSRAEDHRHETHRETFSARNFGDQRRICLPRPKFKC